MRQLPGSGMILAGATITLLAAQPVWAAATQVTAVRLNPTRGGLNVILETAAGDRPQIFTSSRGNALVADIINTQLRLPQGNSFRQDNPAPGITTVSVTQLDRNSVRLVVVGSNSTPASQPAATTAQGITFSISPSTTPVAQTPAPQPQQQPPVQTPSQTPGVLVPNPDVQIQGAPTPQPGTPAPPPFLPRAVAPPVGDIAVSNVDSSASTIDLETNERVPRLVLREAPVREVLALLARAAGLNLAFSAAPAPGTQQAQEPTPGGEDGPRISLDIENESVQDVFNYVLRISGLQANRTGRTIFVAPRLTNEARNVIVRSLRLNQINVGSALNFLVAMGAESAVSRERVVTSVNAVPVGGSATPVTQTQTSTETRVETQRIDFQDSIPLLRGLQVVGDERTNSVSLIGTPRQVEIATAQLVQIDSRRRQVAVNVKIIDVNLVAVNEANTSFSFGIGDSFFVSDGGSAVFNFGGTNPPSAGTAQTNLFGRPVIPNPFGEGQPFLDAQPNAPFGTGSPQQFANPPLQGGNIQTGPGVYPRSPFGTNNNPLQPGVTNIPETGPITFGLPTLFQYPSRFLARLQAEVTNGNAKILTDPTLTVQEGQTAIVNLTQEVFGGFRLQTQTDPTTNLTTQAREPIIKQAGLILQVRVDRIDDNGFVSLSVAPTVSALGDTINTADGTIALLQSRQLTSGQLRLRDNQTLILSGIIQESDRVSVSKVPILGDIPLLGALFRSTRKDNSRQEVIVLLTPQILDDSQNSSFGYNYTPSPEARQMLERRRF
ncbi:type IV pilus secretin family protein [Chroococcidiopsis sp. TS-821]|uniref:type IV pilus secretin family protein n=1 Tax=Chroococcidiopsis sp. TS-821 TaxID=1378066 RepID=UPI000CEDC125|nr:type IV pilus secretin family protein [Chroococcidiopsis sp. TS-821]PPS40258.1 general secretion pathway protein GspD [Chroococcidiopsis sp. TS-821]